MSVIDRNNNKNNNNQGSGIELRLSSTSELKINDSRSKLGGGAQFVVPCAMGSTNPILKGSGGVGGAAPHEENGGLGWGGAPPQEEKMEKIEK